MTISRTPATISASSDIKIKKLVITKGNLDANWETFNATGFKVSPGTMSFNSGVLTVTNINSSTVYR